MYDTREQFDADVVEIEKLFSPLVLKCKELNRAMRIGNNEDDDDVYEYDK